MFGKSRVVLENQFSNNLICDMYKILKNDKKWGISIKKESKSQINQSL